MRATSSKRPHTRERGPLSRVGTDPITATGLASHTVRQAAGGLVQDLEVSTETARVGGREVVRVVVSGRLHPPGPLPALLPIRAVSTLTGQGPVP
jgi:hypothetical protein